MAEWPREFYEETETDAVYGEPIQVVPADLAQELYEALRLSENADPQIDETPAKAIARYEREVEMFAPGSSK